METYASLGRAPGANVRRAFPLLTLPPSAALMRTEPAGGGPCADWGAESPLATGSVAGAVEELDDDGAGADSPLPTTGLPPDDEPETSRAPWSELMLGAAGPGCCGWSVAELLAAPSAELSLVGAAAEVRTTEVVLTVVAVDCAGSTPMPDACDCAPPDSVSAVTCSSPSVTGGGAGAATTTGAAATGAGAAVVLVTTVVVATVEVVVPLVATGPGAAAGAGASVVGCVSAGVGSEAGVAGASAAGSAAGAASSAGAASTAGVSAAGSAAGVVAAGTSTGAAVSAAGAGAVSAGAGAAAGAA